MLIQSKVITPKRDLQRFLNEELRQFINNVINKTVNKIREPIRELVAQSISNSPATLSILDGNLRFHLGIADPKPAIKSIISGVRTSVKIIPRLLNNNLSGGITINILRSDFSEVTNLPLSTYRSNKHNIDWLEWLLFRGSDSIITNYHIKFFIRGRPPATLSRTDSPLMLKGGSWSMPQFAGTQEDNFLTRALDTVANDVYDLLVNTFKSYI